jgi:hypothetical protein
MTVSFDPPAPAPADASHHFDSKGESLEFLSPENHMATGTLDTPPDADHPGAPFLAFQMMTSGRQTGDRAVISDMEAYGDPSMLIVPPLGQFLSEYVFNTDDVFDYMWDEIIIVREEGTEVDLDCIGEIPDSAFQQVGASGWQVARVPIDDPNRADRVRGRRARAHGGRAGRPFRVRRVGVAVVRLPCRGRGRGDQSDHRVRRSTPGRRAPRCGGCSRDRRPCRSCRSCGSHWRDGNVGSETDRYRM